MEGIRRRIFDSFFFFELRRLGRIEACKRFFLFDGELEGAVDLLFTGELEGAVDLLFTGELEGAVDLLFTGALDRKNTAGNSKGRRLQNFFFIRRGRKLKNSSLLSYKMSESVQNIV